MRKTGIQAARSKHRATGTFLPSFILGVVIGIIALMMWNAIGEYVYALPYSLLSPSGPEVYVLGFRIKHWIIGLASMTIGGILLLNRNQTLGGLLIGFGLVLFLDELLTGDLYYWSVGAW